MPNFHDATTFARAWATAALHSIEGAVMRGWLGLKARLAAYERRAVLRLYAPAMMDCLKQLHARVEALEKRGFEGESDIARSVGTFIAKLG